MRTLNCRRCYSDISIILSLSGDALFCGLCHVHQYHLPKTWKIPPGKFSNLSRDKENCAVQPCGLCENYVEKKKMRTKCLDSKCPLCCPMHQTISSRVVRAWPILTHNTETNWGNTDSISSLDGRGLMGGLMKAVIWWLFIKKTFDKLSKLL